MARYLFPLGMTQFFDDSGAPLNGGKLWSYEAGTTTLLATYQEISGGAAHANPIVLDADGRPPAPIWLAADERYKFILQTSASVELDQWDNVFGAAEASVLSVWVAGGAPTYVSATTFTQQGDTSATMHVGRRARLTDSATLYGTITAVSYAAGTNKTTVTVAVDGGTALSASLSAVDYGIEPRTNTALPRDAENYPAISLSDAAQTITPPRGGARYYMTPTAGRTVTITGTNLALGDLVEFCNLSAAQTITIAPSAGSGAKAFTLGPSTDVTLKVVSAAPTTGAHFRKVDGDTRVEVLSSGTSYDPMDFIHRVWVEVYGGGGGGEGGFNPSPGGGAGGAGGMAADYIAILAGTPVTYAIGAAGVGGVGAGVNGTTGGNTTFGALTANGGQGGGITSLGVGGVGGTASGGAVNIPGGDGGCGSLFTSTSFGIGGLGGGNHRGHGGKPGSVGLSGGVGTIFGGGGGGGGGDTTPGNGGNGGVGRVLLSY